MRIWRGDVEGQKGYTVMVKRSRRMADGGDSAGKELEILGWNRKIPVRN